MGILRRLTIDTLKIDRSCISRMGQDPEETAIVHALLSLARELGIAVNGEGVETGLQWEQLRQQRCDQAQGHYFARPLPPEEAEAYPARRLRQAVG